MDGIYLYFVNKHRSRWPLLRLFLTDNDTRSFWGQCRSRSDCTEREVRSLLYTVIFILNYKLALLSSCPGNLFLANEKV